MKCCVPSCTSNDNNKPEGISFHRFPKDGELRDKWLKNIPRDNWTPRSRDVICSLHFDATQIDRFGRKNRIVPDAMPVHFGAHLCQRPKPKGRPKGAKNKNKIIFTKTIEYKKVESDSEVVEVVTHESSIDYPDMANCVLYEIIEFEDNVYNYF